MGSTSISDKMISKNLYNQKFAGEIKHYNDIFKNKFFQEVPNIWLEVQKTFTQRIKKGTGDNYIAEYIVSHTKNNKKLKILGLVSGACGLELLHLVPLLNEKNIKLELTCVDINDQALKQADQEAQKKNVKFIVKKQDINNITLRKNEYDVIIAHASLHHFLKLNHITNEINKSLKKMAI